MDVLVPLVLVGLVVVAGLRTLLRRRTPTHPSSMPPGRAAPTDRHLDQDTG